GARAAAPVSLRSADRRPEDAGDGRTGGGARSEAAEGRPAGDHHYGLLHRSGRNRSAESRRDELPDQAVQGVASARERRESDGRAFLTICNLQSAIFNFIDSAFVINKILRRPRPARERDVAD